MGRDDLRLRMGAVMALGYGAYRNRVPAALSYLVRGLNAGSWGGHVAWTLPSGAGPGRLLRVQSIAGLGVSGNPVAFNALQAEHEKGTATTSDRKAMETAMAANQAIAKSSLADYYASFQAR